MESETPFQKVEAFHKIFDPRRPEIPTAFNAMEAHTRAAFKIEELVEFVQLPHQVKNNYMKLLLCYTKH